MTDRYPDNCEIHGEMEGWFNGHPYCVPCDNKPFTLSYKWCDSCVFHWFDQHAGDTT
jgi:hypothetical protein